MRKISFFLLLFSTPIYAFEVGVGIHPESFSGNSVELINLLRTNHISTFRTDYPWNQVEKNKGVYSPASKKIEQTISLAKENNIKPLIIYDYGNILYEEKTLVNPRSKPTSTDSINHFVNYVKWSTDHLKNTVSMFEIWNEWIQMAGPGNREQALSDSSAKDYAKLTLESCKAIKEINPKAIVIAGSTSPLDEESNKWLLKVINYGVLNCIDGISLHAYSFNYNKKLDYKPIISSIQNLQLKINNINHGKQVPFFITETGVPSISNTFYTLNDIANYFENYTSALSKLNYVHGVWWYDFIDDGTNKTNAEHNFGILNTDFSQKPIALKFPEIIRKYTK